MDIKVIITAIIISLVLALILGILLAIASKFLVVEQDTRIDKVIELLPGYNCGACGKAGCAAFAESLLTGESKSISGCKVIKPEKKQVLKDYLDNNPGPDGTITKVTL